MEVYGGLQLFIRFVMVKDVSAVAWQCYSLRFKRSLDHSERGGMDGGNCPNHLRPARLVNE
jgi:hypothetical protein